jgi:hypothetical protein
MRVVRHALRSLLTPERVLLLLEARPAAVSDAHPAAGVVGGPTRDPELLTRGRELASREARVGSMTRTCCGVGGGITALSDPRLEWQECLHKAARLEKLLRTGIQRGSMISPASGVTAAVMRTS